MKKYKSLPKNDLYEDHPSHLINEEKQTLKISYLINLSKKPQKKKKDILIRPLVLLYFLIVLFILYLRNIKLYIKKREINRTLENEFPLNIEISEKISSEDEDEDYSNYNDIKHEIGEYNKEFSLSYEHVEYLYQRDEPKISIIVPINNDEKNIKSLYASIFNQGLKDIEIIFIDNNSTDKSIQIIEELMKLDKRIILIKHNIKLGNYYSRNEGVKMAKSKYVLVLNSIGLIINNILEKSYIAAEKYNLDITQFYTIQRNSIKMNIIDYPFKTGIVYQPQIKEIFYHSKSVSLCNKLIKKETFLKSIDFMDSEYKYKDYQIYEDDVVFYGLTKVSNSFGFLEKIGYYDSNCNDLQNLMANIKFDTNEINQIFDSMFTILKYYYYRSEINRKEKLLVAYKFFIKKVYSFQNFIKYIDEGYTLINEVLDLYLECSLLSNSEKYFLVDFKNKIMISEKKNKNN
jgi:glycosyltransferase involved in cell wall biosynthesis